MYVTLLNETGIIEWVSGTLDGVQVDDVLGEPAWRFASDRVSREIKDALRRTLAGEVVVHTAVIFIGKRIRHLRSVWRLADLPPERKIVVTTSEVRPEFMRLTERQKAVLQCLIDCESNSDASRVLGLSERTIETHLRNIRRVLRVKTRKDLVAFAARHLFADEVDVGRRPRTCSPV